MGLQVGEKQHLRKQISFYSAVREWKTSLATPSSLVLSLTFGNCVTAHRKVIHYQGRGRHSLNFWTDERFVLQSNELVWTMASKAQHKILLPIVCLEKIEKPPFMFGFALVRAIVPCDLENSPLLFPAKAFRLWNVIIFETSEKNIWTKGVDPLWTKALFIIIFFFLDPFATLHLNQKHRHLVTLLASPQEMFLVNHECHSAREFFIQCTWCLVQVWVFLSTFLGWACPEISSPFCLQQFRAPLCVVVGVCLFS